MSLARVQEIADQLASEIGCAIAVNDYALDLIAASAQVGEVDRYRVESIMQRHTPLEVTALLWQRSLMRRSTPFSVPAGSLPDMRERMCVPLVENGLPIAFLWIVVGDQKLEPSGMAAVYAAAEAILHELQTMRSPAADDLLSNSHDLQRVLDTDATAAGYAVAALVADGLMDEASGTSVTVFEVTDGDGGAPADVQGIFRAVHARARTTWARRALLGIFEGSLVLVTASRATEAAMTAALDDIPRVLPDGIRLAAAGISERDSPRRGLRPAFDEARYAARVAGRAAALGRVVRYAELGLYVALRDLEHSEESVRMLSAAATELRRASSRVDADTVLTYLNHSGDVQSTCRALMIHRTTLYYRLEKIREVIGDALDVGVTRSSLHLALLLGEQLDGGPDRGSGDVRS